MSTAVNGTDVEALAAAPPDARIIVTGGAGVGKTHLLCARLRSLVIDHGLSPGAEILAVSFTRAAVAEIGRRLQSEPPRVQAVRPATFDSLATRLLSDFSPLGDWIDTGYDDRIEAAAQALSEATDLGLLTGVRHVLVDECQDLVGPRANFVLALLDTLEAGYTILGDPAQAIYGFSVAGRETPFIARAEAVAPDDPPIRTRLEGNKRARTREACAALWAGPLLESGDDAAPEVLDRLLDEIRDQPEIGDIDAAAPMLDGATGRTALLCRTNGDALLIAERLRCAGVRYRLQLEAEDRPLAPWLAMLFQGWDRSAINKTDFTERLAEVAGDQDAELVWATVKKMAGGPLERLEIDRLRRALRIRRRPTELLVRQPDQLVLSSVHRSKGLEFDRVVLVAPDARRIVKAENLAEETRVLYVAMTRARDDIFQLTRLSSSRFMTCDRGRWRLAAPEWWKTRALELRSGDVEKSEAPTPARSSILALMLPHEEVDLHRDNDDLIPRYRIQREGGEVVGRTSPAFWWGLKDALRLVSAEAAPVGFVRAEVPFVETVVGSPEESNAAGLGTAGFWLVPRLGGLSCLRWHGDEEENAGPAE